MSVSYAQNFEDVVLTRALQHVDKGFYIDIGAQDPVVSSVSLSFYEKGWRGVHVEPSRPYAAALRAARPDETVFEVAIGHGDRVMTLHEVADSGLSTGEAAVAARAAKAGFISHDIDVPILSLGALLGRYAEREIHWLKIDVEGMETDVLDSWGDCEVRPWILVIEAVMPLGQEPTHEEWEPLVLERGYRLAYRDGLNRFYVSASHLELAERLDIPPNVFDSWHLSGLSGNPFATLLNQTARRFEEAARTVSAEHEQVCSMLKAALTIDAEGSPSQGQDALTRLVEAMTSQFNSIRRRCEELERGLAAERQARAADAGTRDADLAALRQEATRLDHQCEVARTAHAAVDARLADRLAELSLLQASFAEARAESSLREARLAALCESMQAESLLRLQSVEQARVRDDAEWHRTLREVQARHDQAMAEREERLRQLDAELASTSHESAARIQHLESTLSVARFELVAQRAAAQADTTRYQGMLSALDDQLAAVHRSALWQLARVLGIGPRKSKRPGELGMPARADIAPLLGLGDIDFVREAYRLVLRREADPLGEANYLAKIRSGRDRKAVLADLRLSAEGERAGTALSGLERMLWRRRLVRSFRSPRPDRAQILQSPDPVAEGEIAVTIHSPSPDGAPIPSRKETVLLQEVLTLHDVAFVRAAYRLILNRDPDASGEATYVNLLRQGHDKVLLLGAISNSDEARARRIEVPGLARALRRRRWSRVPLIGPLAGGVAKVLGIKPRLDQDEAFRNQVLGMHHATLDVIGQLLQATKEIEKRQLHLEGALSRTSSRPGEVRRFRG